MSDIVLLDVAAQDLKSLLSELALGETVTLADADGKPLALLVSLNPELPRPVPDPDWIKKWDALAKEIDEAWQGEKTGLEELAEMRR
jgi:antitoxin (DNA-binding transcriptional repressor) of toxin-antitoxin stability system